MAKEQKRSKKGFSLKILFIIELLACYMSILAVISYWRGPVQCRALNDEILLQAEDFISFAGETVADNAGGLRFKNDTAGNAVGYAAWLNIAEVNPVAVSFTVDCSEENAGSVLHIDLWNADYDSDEQEFQLALEPGINKAEFFLDKGLNAPETAQLRFFTLDLADYVVQDIQICRAEPMPKVSSALLAGMIVCIVLLLITVPLMLKSERECALADTWRKAGEYEEEVVVVKGLIKKIVRKLTGWYVEPVYQQNAYLREELEKNQLALTEFRKSFDEYRQLMANNEQQFADSVARVHNHLNCVQEQLDNDLTDCNDRLNLQQSNIDSTAQGIVNLQDTLHNLQKDLVSWNQLVERMQARSEIDLKQAIIINDYINSNQTAIIYAYRYLLAREPENVQLITNNQRDWRQLREDVMDSEEYRNLAKYEFPVGMSYYCLEAEGLTYFYNKGDIAIPSHMMQTGKNWAAEDIRNFVKFADDYVYKGFVQRDGIFLDIGGNIGTTSIYCNKKVKPELKYIAFEPISLLAKLFSANVAFNNAHNVIVENVGLSNQIKQDVPMIINHTNQGNNKINFDEQLEADEFVRLTTLDAYLAEHSINQNDIRYVWLDVEGHEPEVLEGANVLFNKKKIPTCIEFNQGIYMEQQKYDKMLSILSDYFDQFIVCSSIGTENERLRPINELNMLWDEFDQESCDLILF